MKEEIRAILGMKKKPQKDNISFFGKLALIQEQRQKINSLETELEVLKDNIKDEFFKKFMAQFNEPLTIARLKKENKRLRETIARLKEDL